MKRTRILVDCDGVLSNFIKKVIATINVELRTNYTYDQATQWDLYKALSISEADGKYFDNMFCQRGFCSSLDEIPGASLGLAQLREFADVYCVTAPFSNSKHWRNERDEWLQTHMGFKEKEILPVHCKYMIAGDYLVDDKVENLRTWMVERHAGRPILYDQPWNQHERDLTRVNDWPQLVRVIKYYVGINE